MINTIENEYDEEHRLVKEHNVMEDEESGKVVNERITQWKFDSRGYVVEIASTTISNGKTLINKCIYDYADEENFTITDETKINDVVTATSTTENKSIVHDNEKTIISSNESSKFKSNTGEYNGGSKDSITLTNRYDDLNRLTYTKQSSIHIEINKTHEETTDFENEILSEYIYDADDSLSCNFTEYEKKTQGEETLGTSKQGRREEIDSSTILETYGLYKDPNFSELKTYCKDYTTYDNLGRVIYIRKYNAGEAVSTNDEHLWFPSDFRLLSYIGNSEKILSSFSMVLEENSVHEYDFTDTYRTVDKYNRWTNEEHREYTFSSISTDNDYFIEREYAEPVPVNPDIPQPIEE